MSSSAYGYGITGKIEEELALHIKKALSIDETAPKQKHVRACIVYTWDIKSSGSFWVILKNHPVFGDEVVSFKSLITFHKVIKDGHPSVLKDAIREAPWLDNVVRGISHLGNRGYGILIKAYVQYLHAKLDYHKYHPEFNGSFDYEEYVSLKGIEDPNEGFETISELLNLLQKLDSFQKVVFANLRGGYNNECRIAALVPLVEESHGIYQFLVSMLTAMHQIIGSVEALAPLRDRFKASHYALLKFYHECNQIRYLISLIAIPKLSQDPPDFLAQGPPTKQPKKKVVEKPKEPNALDNVDVLEQERMLREFERQKQDRELLEHQQSEQQRQLELQRQMELQRQQQELQRQMELQRQAELQRQQEEDRMRMLQLQQQQNAVKNMEQQMLQQRVMELQAQLEALRSQSMRDKGALDESDLKIRALENQLAQISLRNDQADRGKDDALRRLQDELNQWKQKYEALAKLYAQLRKEHLDLLTKFKELRDSNSKVSDEARKEVDKVRMELRQKGSELSNIMIERDRLKGEADRVRVQYEEELGRLRKELDFSNTSLQNMSKAKGAEVQLMMEKFNLEKDQLEKKHAANLRQLQDTMRQLEEAQQQLSKMKLSQDDESSVLQAGLDQALLALANLQKSSQEKESELSAQIQRLESDHFLQLNKMMDNILSAAMLKIEDALFEFESAANEGNQTASPEYVLLLLEKVQDTCVDFGNSFVHLVEGADQVDAISASNALPQILAQMLFNAKGVMRLATSEDVIDNIVYKVKNGASSIRYLLSQMKSEALLQVESERRADHIVNLTKQTLNELISISPVFEQLVPEEVSLSKTVVEDIEALVEKEMKMAAEAIQQAAYRLDQLILNSHTNVHSSIIGAAKKLTDAVWILIQRATDSQHEIVAHGRGSTTSGAFYKKNNKWTEGLISAAKSVAVATTYLVECADGLVNKTHSMEQLIVAAQEVSVATTQLVAAARVKAIPFSKTQDRLEEAASAVREATKQLVKAAKEASKQSSEQRIQAEISEMSRHQFKVIEMEQQVRVLELEKELQNARFKLAAIRKSGYTDREEY